MGGEKGSGRWWVGVGVRGGWESVGEGGGSGDGDGRYGVGRGKGVSEMGEDVVGVFMVVVGE